MHLETLLCAAGAVFVSTIEKERLAVWFGAELVGVANHTHIVIQIKLALEYFSKYFCLFPLFDHRTLSF